MQRADLEVWIDRYVQAWRSAGTAGLRDLFTADVTYLPSPWDEPVIGLAALARFWEREREGPDEGFTLTAEVVAVDGAVGVARIAVSYADGARWRDLWLVRLAADGRCSTFEEWPFAPSQPDGHGRDRPAP